ncbi:hypothetical protein JTB14_021860 [Gonioctena quinquepunctata]|nr:hypothetical protein JTB14_021860 [Gonioctena quinquepunctata]
MLVSEVNKFRLWRKQEGPSDYRRGYHSEFRGDAGNSNYVHEERVYRRNRQFLREARSRLTVSSSSSDSFSEDSPEFEDEPPANLSSGKHEREGTSQPVKQRMIIIRLEVVE